MNHFTTLHVASMYFYPVLSDYTTPQLPWQIKTFFINMVWPLKDNPSTCLRLLNFFLLTVEFLGITFVNVGSIRFIVENHNNINLSVEALVSYIVLSEASLRIFHMAFKRESFKHYLQAFYGRIYVDETENWKVCRKIRHSLLPTTIYSYGYILTLVAFFSMPIWNAVIGKETVLPCKIIVDYDIENVLNYNLTMAVVSCVGVWLFVFFIGEAYLWANCILHLNARYKMLQTELEEYSTRLISLHHPSKLAKEFRKNFGRMYTKVCDLNKFSVLLDSTYSFRLFVILCFSTLILCVLCFQIVEAGLSSQSVAYGSWLVAKVAELLIYGTLGGKLNNTTDKISSMYYFSNWEQIIYRSTNTRQNVLLLKNLQIAILLHSKPIRITGLNFFVISLSTTEKVLRLSGSYFAFLYTIKQITMT